MEHKEPHTHSLRDSIVAKIGAEKITMRPRVYFTIRIAAAAVLSILVLLVSVFIFNFILFSIRINSHDAFLSFGPRGIEAFLRFFPWPLLLLDIVLIALLDRIVRTFKFGYRSPVVYLVGGILLITLLAGLVLDRATPFNDQLMTRAEGDHHLPPLFEELYRDVRRPPHDGICRCTIMEIGTSTLTVEDHHHGATSTFTVILPDNDPHATSTGLKVGDVVMVAGDKDEGVIRAFGVRKAEAGHHEPAPDGIAPLPYSELK